MLWIISAAAVAGIAAAGVVAALWWVQWRKARRYMDAIIRKDGALNDARNDCDRWKHEACVHLERERAAVEQAKLFERVSKTMEEHVTAERGRADRLAAALRESEEKCEQLQKELSSKENVLADATKMVRALNIDIDKFMQENGLPLIGRSGSPAVTMDQLAQEFANIAAYNGTDEGQVELKHG